MKLLQRTDLGDGFYIDERQGRSAGLVATKFFALQLGADGRLVGSRDYVAVDRADAEAKIKEWRSQ